MLRIFNSEHIVQMFVMFRIESLNQFKREKDEDHSEEADDHLNDMQHLLIAPSASQIGVK